MDRLDASQSLAVNASLQSKNGYYKLVLQGDGNLVLYQGIPNAPVPFWDTGTQLLPSSNQPTKADMQTDGNFVLYNNAMIPAWATNTGPGNPGAYLILQDDRNLVVYGSNNKPLWASNTNISGPIQSTQPLHENKQANVGYRKTMLTDAVLYRNGQLAVDCQVRNDNWLGGLRGQVLVICKDAGGNAIWVSQVFQCPTAGSLADLSCASYLRVNFIDQFPAVIGKHSASLDIYQADNPNYPILRDSFVQAIKAAGSVIAEVMAVLSQLM